MKNLDLNNYGVQEMNAGEMREVEGGSLWSAVCDAVEAVGEALGQAWDWVTKPHPIYI